jgi:hypothetical protein
MNRYSMLFALLVASTFAVHPTPAGDAGATADETKKTAPAHPAEPLTEEPVRFLEGFLEKAGVGSAPGVKSGAGFATSAMQVLFATVPHPVETHLAAEFDGNVEALQDGLQESGYLLDSAWIPWHRHEPRDGFDDDKKEKHARAQENESPGILLFRKNGPARDAYPRGLVVFLISEKPTEGIALPEVETAVAILKLSHIPFSGPIRILGPSFSGSFASLGPVVSFLHQQNPAAEVLIRSGCVSGGKAAAEGVGEIARLLGAGTHVDFGSTFHDNADWIGAAVRVLTGLGIDRSSIASLSENESSYGYDVAPTRIIEAEKTAQQVATPGSSKAATRASGASPQSPPQSPRQGDASKAVSQEDLTGLWTMGFPRDISSLRQGYEKQGILSQNAPAQPWKRFLNLKSNDRNEGDSIRHFGDEETLASEEAVLFGISEFVKAHGIRAVIVSATNKEDLLFLSEFLHAHNSGVRVAVVGSTRIFMRGSTAQFSGDLVVDVFPLLPRLPDWTGSGDERTAHIFPDDVSQGTYFAAIDLFAQAHCVGGKTEMPCPSSGTPQYKWYPEYAAPDWEPGVTPVEQPPMYVAALGSNATWPVSEDPGKPFADSSQDQPAAAEGQAAAAQSHPGAAPNQPVAAQGRPVTGTRKQDAAPEIPGAFQVAMPFRLFAHDQPAKAEEPHGPTPQQFRVARHWKDLFGLLALLTAIYCACFRYADPLTRVVLSSFAPLPEWRFWVLKVTIPATMAGCAFKVMAWAVEIPLAASPGAVFWWRFAEILTVAAPLAIALSAVSKADFGERRRWRGKWTIGMAASFLPAVAMAVWFLASGILARDPFAGRPIGVILNTYREMHWESGLSLLPTWMFFLLAIWVWSSQGGNGGALFEAAPRLPDTSNKRRISQARAEEVQAIGQPLPGLRKAGWMWTAWGVFAGSMLYAHFHFPPFVQITTLEPYGVTCLVRAMAAVISTLMVLDVLQFVGLWGELRGLLRALDREKFKRSFVPIHDFNWRNLWSMTGTSLNDRRAILGLQIDCVLALESEAGFARPAARLKILLKKYNKIEFSRSDRRQYRWSLKRVYRELAVAGAAAADLTAHPPPAPAPPPISADTEALQRVLACQCKGDGGRFSDEAEDLARLPERQQTAERLLCLIYIGFIQMVVARLHTLLVSSAFMFSLVTLGIAIYPFVPFNSLLVAGMAMLLLIGFAFFKVFSEMDRDPILSRIVDGDDRKLQGSFYLKFGEAIALPLLTLGSSMLPGGTGRLLELVETLLSHGQ